MRSFEHFLRRRGVKDIQSWLAKMKIESDAQLSSWCKDEQIAPPEKKYFKPAPAATQQAAPAPTTTTTDEQDQSWHIPAAERSRKVRGSKTSKSKSISKPTKKTKK